MNDESQDARTEEPTPTEASGGFLSRFPILKKPWVAIPLMLGGALLLLVPLFILIKSSSGPTVPPTPTPTPGEAINYTDPFKMPYIPDQLIVKFKDRYTLEEIENLRSVLSKIGVISQEPVFDSDDPSLRNYYLLKFKPGTDIKKIKEELDKIPEIEFAGPNHEVVAFEAPNDPSFPSQWDFQKIKMSEAWDISHGSNPVTVAVIDTGVDYNHSDFATRNIVKGRNYVSNNNNPLDDVGHGTHVSGTIGAVTNNSLGVSGINWNNTSILAIKTLGASGTGQTAWTVDAIRSATDQGVNVINMSLGLQPGNCSLTPQYQAALNYARSKNVTVIVAAGNATQSTGGKPVDVKNNIPASCDGLIVVGNADQNDARASTSNYGTGVDIAAPGVKILSTWLGGNYTAISGTSMAAPHVAGVAAMLLSVKPGLSPDQVTDCIVKNADPISTDKAVGPRLNASKTISACSGLAAPTTTPTPTPTGAPGVTTVPSQSPTDRKITGFVFIDNNGNGKLDSGDPGIPNVTVVTTGFAARSTTTGANGAFLFDSVAVGTYVVSATINNLTAKTNPTTLTENIRELQVFLGFPPSVVSSSPVPGEPTPVPVVVTPIVVTRPNFTPTPTPQKTYSCRQREGSVPKNAITIGDLVCTPNP